jgi:3-oxoacyl-[acyl-carrier protein] reductase
MAHTIVVTGASRGIGFHLAQSAAADGHTVIALSRNIAPLQNQKGIHPFAVDLSDEAKITAVVSEIKKQFSQIDTLINNAGTLEVVPFAASSFSLFEKTFAVNVFGVAALTRALLPMISKSGHVVNISSMGGVQGSAKFPGLAAYSSSKGALITLTELLAEEYKTTGPAFNVLALGAVQTEMLATAFPGYQAPVQAEAMAQYILEFSITGQQFYNGKLLPVALGTP